MQISASEIRKVTNHLTGKFGAEIAADAVGDALIKVCEYYDPNHPSGASVATYLRQVAENRAVELYRANHPTKDIENTLIVSDVLDCDHTEFNQVPLWLANYAMIERIKVQLQQMRAECWDTPSKVAHIKVAERIIGVLVDYLDDEDLLASSSRYGNNHGARNRAPLYGALGEQLGLNERTIKNSFVYLMAAARRAEPEACRQVAL